MIIRCDNDACLHNTAGLCMVVELELTVANSGEIMTNELYCMSWRLELTVTKGGVE